MRAIDGRHWLGLLLIGMGLMVAVIYFGQSNPAAPSTPSAPPTPRYYGPLVPTSLGRTTPTQQTAQVNDPTATEPPTVEVVSVTASATRTPFNTATRAAVTKRPTTQAATVASSATARATRTLTQHNNPRRGHEAPDDPSRNFFGQRSHACPGDRTSDDSGDNHLTRNRNRHHRSATGTDRYSNAACVLLCPTAVP